MYNFIARVNEVKKDLSTSAFARKLGMGQKTVDFYLRAERKPSVEFVLNICTKFNVSADWLLGLTNSCCADCNNSAATVDTSTNMNSNSVTTTPPDCATCKYKRLADAFKAL